MSDNHENVMVDNPEPEKIRVYRLRKVKELYRAATGDELQNQTLAWVVQKGKVTKVIPPDALNNRGFYTVETVDAWIASLAKKNNLYVIVA